MTAMYDVLCEVGFVRNPHLLYDSVRGLSLDLGEGVTLDAIHCIHERGFRPVVLLTGALGPRYHLKQVEKSLPQIVDSREHGLALLAHALDDALGREFFGTRVPAWLAEGRAYRLLVPSVRELAEYEARPRCVVPARWVRPLMDEINEHLEFIDEPSLVRISFDGHIFVVTLANILVAVTASGRPWQSMYSVDAGELRAHMPTRLRAGRRTFEIKEDQLFIDSLLLGHVVPIRQTPVDSGAREQPP